jgi:hypothetical protein
MQTPYSLNKLHEMILKLNLEDGFQGQEKPLVVRIKLDNIFLLGVI